jgi:hypothetical protein
LALTAGYFRTWYGNFTVTDNLAVTPADYDPYCITAPVDARLPGVSGNQICGLYDLKSAAFGRTDNLVSQASHFGQQLQVYNGVDLAINARFREGGLLSGGVSTGRTVTDNCEVIVDSPDTRFCRQTLPFAAQTQVKFYGVYPLPFWGLQTSATFQNLPGIPVAANYVASTAEIRPSLGRNLSACPAPTGSCTATVTVPNLYEPNTVLEDRLTQVDVRLIKTIRLGRARVQGMFDVYNLFNGATITAVNATYGASWLTPNGILPARLFKFSVQLDF